MRWPPTRDRCPAPSADRDRPDRTNQYYRIEGGDQFGARFFDTAVASLRAIETMPGAGTPRIGELCEIPRLRVRRILGFPCGWFYFVHKDQLDVIRLLADAQDLPAILADLEQQ